MHAFTINALVPPTLKAGESTFEHYFHPLFVELQDFSFIVDNWRPDDIHPQKKEILARYQVAVLNIGRRVLPVYRGREFLPKFGFAIPPAFGRVFAFALVPDELTIRSSTYDGCHIDDSMLAPKAGASFLAFEGAWTFASDELRLAEILRAGLSAGAVLEESPSSLKALIGLL
jgi:hypothetical protein